MKKVLLSSVQMFAAAGGMALATVALLIPAANAAAQVVIFDNSPSAGIATTHSGTGGGSTFGDLVSAGGTARTVTAFSTEIEPLASFTADVSLRLYNRAAGDTVGTQIGSTMTQNAVSLSPGLTTISFTSFAVSVPDDFIWAVSIATGDAWFGYNMMAGSNPTVGSTAADTAYGSGAWLGLPEGESLSFLGSPGGNLRATITAVPEPAGATIVFGLAAMLAGVVLRRRR